MPEAENSSAHDLYYGPTPVAVLEDGSLRYYVGMLRRRFWTILPVFVVVGTIGIISACKAPDVYRAMAKVMVERQIPQVLRVDGAPQENLGWDPNFYQTQVELCRSREVLERALRMPDISGMFPTNGAAGAKPSFASELKQTVVTMLGAVPAPPPEPWERLQGRVRAEHVKDTYFLHVTSSGTNPEDAAKIVNAVSAALEDYHISKKAELLGDAFLFLERERKKQEAMLLAAESELQKFREEAKQMTVPIKNDAQPTLDRLAELSEALTDVQMRRIELSAQLGVVRDVQQSAEASQKEKRDRLFVLPAIRGDADASAAHRDLTTAQGRVSELEQTYGPQHPTLVAAVAEAARLDQQFSDVLNKIVLGLESQAQTLEGQEEALKKEQEEQKAKALELAKESFVFARLENEVGRHQKLYDALTERIREVDVSSGFIRTNAEVVETASVPNKPAGPKRAQRVAIALALGLALGVGLAFVTESLDDTIKTPEDLKQRLSMPLLGFVPRIKLDGGETPTEAGRSYGLVCTREPMSSAAEAYRNIRTKLLFSLPAGEKRVVGFTSCNPGEGKTTTSTNLALATAMTGKRVLLIDADIHRPMVHQVFNIKESPGLTDILAAGADVEKVTQRYPFEDTSMSGTLDIITAGPESPNPAELLGSWRMTELLTMAKAHYDWVFVDIPPVLFISDASIMSALCEGIILVIRAAKNNRSILVRTKEQLEELHVHIIGSVLNDVILGRWGRKYSDYSYYGYSRYSREYHKSYYAKDGRVSREKPEAEPKAGS